MRIGLNIVGPAMNEGRLFVVVGACLIGIGLLVFAPVMPTLMHLLFPQEKLVDYAQYMMEAAVLVHSAILAVCVLLAVPFIWVGMRRIKKARQAGTT